MRLVRTRRGLAAIFIIGFLILLDGITSRKVSDGFTSRKVSDGITILKPLVYSKIGIVVAPGAGNDANNLEYGQVQKMVSSWIKEQNYTVAMLNHTWSNPSFISSSSVEMKCSLRKTKPKSVFSAWY